MLRKTTVSELGQMLSHVAKHMATKEDIADVRKDMATKDQIISLHTQVNSIETQPAKFSVVLQAARLLGT